MPNIRVIFYSLLVDIIGNDEISISFNGKLTIRDILVKLRSSIGKIFEENVFNSEDKLNKYIILGLNGKDIRKFDSLDTIIKNGDELSFLPAIAGG